jgi:hypothetical protein
MCCVSKNLSSLCNDTRIFFLEQRGRAKELCIILLKRKRMNRRDNTCQVVNS